MFTSIEETAEYENYNCMQSLEEYDEAQGYSTINDNDYSENDFANESVSNGGIQYITYLETDHHKIALAVDDVEDEAFNNLDRYIKHNDKPGHFVYVEAV